MAEILALNNQTVENVIQMNEKIVNKFFKDNPDVTQTGALNGLSNHYFGSNYDKLTPRSLRDIHGYRGRNLKILDRIYDNELLQN